MKVLRTLINHEADRIESVVRVDFEHPTRGHVEEDSTVTLIESKDLPDPHWSNYDLERAIEAKIAETGDRFALVTVATPPVPEPEPAPAAPVPDPVTGLVEGTVTEPAPEPAP